MGSTPLCISGCTSLTEIDIPEGVKNIESWAFGRTDADNKNRRTPLEKIRFYGNPPEQDLYGIFEGFYGTVYYPENNELWSNELIKTISEIPDSDITWTAWDAPEIEKAENKFTDVKRGAWYVSGIQYVYENGIMSGMSGAEFAPMNQLTREQLMQVFFAMEGLDKADYEGETGFSDAPEGRWYSPAVKWAKAEGITNGIKEDTFGIGRHVTREQLATFIMNYTGFKKGDVSLRAELASFSDADKVSDWAVAGMEFCVEKGIINGRADGTLDPRTSANRAELAQMLKQYAAQ